MEEKRNLSFRVFLVVAISLFGILVAQTIFATNTVTSSVTVGNAAPTVSSVVLNNASSIILTANTTTSINVTAIWSDNNGCSDILNGTTSILLYRTGVGSSTCLTAQNNLNCYKATAFNATSSCVGGQTSMNTTTTFSVYYFAQATDASSSFPTDSWIATVDVTDPSGATGTASSATDTLKTLTALNVTTSSINYGTLAASSTTGAANQSTTVANAGNSSTTLQLSGNALTSGANSIATSSQHYATSTFTYGNNEQQLQGNPTAVSGFLLTSPTSTNNVASTVFWGDAVPASTATGTYTGTLTFTAVFSS